MDDPLGTSRGIDDNAVVAAQLPDARFPTCDNPSMLAAFSITPLGVGDSVSESVADAVRIVRDSDLPNETNAMFTNVEGEWDEVMALIKSCVMTVAEQAPRVSVVVKLDYRPAASSALTAKMQSLETHLRGQ